MPRWIAVLLVAPLVAGALGCHARGITDTVRPRTAEAQGLDGTWLYAPPLDDETRRDREAKLAEAQRRFEADPADHDAIVWFGRRTAYMGDYRRAIDIFSNGLSHHPDSAELLRHRGHRYISVRQLDPAIADLERAARLVEGKKDRVEPDGLPNARNIPTSTLHSNIWYHLGLAYYVRGDLDRALSAYRECMKVSGNPDMLVATSHWLYMTLRRMGRDDEAAKVLEPIDAGMEIIENEGYHRLLLLYKGELEEEELLDGGDDALVGATVGYGIGNWHLYNGRRERAFEIFRQVKESPMWPAFGYLAAEAELIR